MTNYNEFYKIITHYDIFYQNVGCCSNNNNNLPLVISQSLDYFTALSGEMLLPFSAIAALFHFDPFAMLVTARESALLAITLRDLGRRKSRLFGRLESEWCTSRINQDFRNLMTVGERLRFYPDRLELRSYVESDRT